MRYKTLLKQVLLKYGAYCSVVVIENEEYNQGYYFDDRRNYVSELRWALNVCHSIGVKVTNGGLHDPFLAMHYYKTLDADSARKFMNKYFTDVMVAATQRSSNNYWSYYNGSDSLYNEYMSLGLDYFNCHMYQRDDNYLDYDYIKALSDHVKRTMKIELACNEWGIRVTNDPGATQRILSAFRLSRTKEINYYSSASAETGSSQSLIVNGKLSNDGRNYKDYVIQY